MNANADCSVDGCGSGVALATETGSTLMFRVHRCGKSESAISYLPLKLNEDGDDRRQSGDDATRRRDDVSHDVTITPDYDLIAGADLSSAGLRRWLGQVEYLGSVATMNLNSFHSAAVGRATRESDGLSHGGAPGYRIHVRLSDLSTHDDPHERCRNKRGLDRKAREKCPQTTFHFIH